MKSVNHRYLDVNLKMPKKLNFFEAAIRNLLKEYIQRGKVHYALLPVWMLHTKWQGKDYLFAMNGETGQMAALLVL